MGTSLQEVSRSALGIRHQWAACFLSEAPVGPGDGDEGMALELGPHWIGERA